MQRRAKVRVSALTQNPKVTVVKTADISGLSAGGGAPGDVIIYSFFVKNEGNVTLTNITLADPLPNLIMSGMSIATLVPGDSDSTTFSASYVITSADISAGFIDNTATATGRYRDVSNVEQTTTDASGSDATNNTPTHVALTAAPALTLVKTAIYNDVTAPTGANSGDTVTYSFVITNTGNVTLTNLDVTDPMLVGLSCPQASLNVGASYNCSHVYTLSTSDLTTGKLENTAVVDSTAIIGGVVRVARDRSGTLGTNNTPTVTPLVIPKATLNKSVNKSTAAVGDTLTFKIAATNVVLSPAQFVDTLPAGMTYVPNSATVNGAALEPVVSGNKLTFNGATPIGGVVEIVLKVVVNTAAGNGPIVNNVELIGPNGVSLGKAQAKVKIQTEHVFDCGDIIGKVFDDKNNNGVQDNDEPGLPAARVTTVRGELITSDAEGRFHIGCADIGDARNGSNFLLKLDTRSLPSGYRLTTENPRVVRLTRGKLTKLNFGAAISRVIKLDLTDKVFAAGTVETPTKIRRALVALISKLDDQPSTIRLNYLVGREGKDIAAERVRFIEEFIGEMWREKGGRYKLPIESKLVQTTQKASN
jgi:uncharacterized repeat protein (TIGR01451 family)